MSQAPKQLSNQQKKKLFQGYMIEQQKYRQHKLKQKKQEELDKKNPEEHMLYIQKQFKIRSESLQANIKKYKQKEEVFQNIMEQYLSLKDYYVNMCYALKTYDRQSYKEALDKLYNTIMDLKKRNEPQKKFKFKRRDQDFGVKGVPEEESVHAIKQVKEHIIPGIKGRNGETIIVKQGWSNMGSYKVVQCQNCTVQLHDKTQILFLKKLKNCTVKTALAKSTVFVDECVDCDFQINCHQLRIHNSYSTTFRIFVTSKAIIEDCKQVKFTPYSFDYEGKQKDEKEFERVGKQNLWRQIQDFNWLKENQKSPHYQLIQI